MAPWHGLARAVAASVGRPFNRAPDARDSWFTGVLAQRASVGLNLGAIVGVANRQNVLVSIGRGLADVQADRASFFLAWQLEQ